MPISTEQLGELEEYYDDVPRVGAIVEEIGPFTLFLKDSEDGWSYYARPRLGGTGPFTVDDINRVRQRQREREAPEAFEWVHETTPELQAVAHEAGLEVERYPLMVLGTVPAQPSLGPEVVMLGTDDDRIGAVQAAVHASFSDTDEVGEIPDVDAVRRGIAGGTLRLAGAFDHGDVLGGGSHSPRSGVTELMGIGVLPRARRRGVGAAITAALVTDARRLGVTTVFLSAGSQRIADIYARVGFESVATACIAERAP